MCFKNTTKKEQVLEIVFRGFPRCSRPSRSKVRVNVSHLQTLYDHPTPPELWDRFIWRQAVENPGYQRSRSGLSHAEDSLDIHKNSYIWRVFIGYLEDQWTVSVHILQFASTHQYCRTVKYEPNRITGSEDRSGYVFEPIWLPTNHNTDMSRSDRPGPVDPTDRPTKNWISIIFITNGPIWIILCSSTALVSTSKL